MRILSPWSEGASGFLFILSLLSAYAAVSATSAPNIVFLLADDLGWNHVSWHNDIVISPNMQRLVDTGILLEQSYVQPLCTPSRSALMTGMYPFKLGRQGRPLGSSMPTGLTFNHTLLPERLSSLGYATHMIGKWHLGYCHWAYTPVRRGFDSYYGYFLGMQDYYTHTIKDGYDFRDDKKVDYTANGTYGTHLFADRAVTIIEEHQGKDQPIFLYLAFQNVHEPLQVPDEYLANYPEDLNEDIRTILGMVTAMDEAVGQVVDALKNTGLYDNTVIIFSSDNETNYPLWGHKASVWEGGTRAAGFVHSPLLKGTPRVHNGLFHITDWYNTLLAVAGETDLPSNDGFNQWDALRNASVPSPPTTFVYNLDNAYNNSTLGAIRLNNHKFVMGEDSDPMPEDNEGPWLFNLEDDPNEEVNLVEVLPELAMAMELLLVEEISNLVPKDEPDGVHAADPSNYDGVWTPGWCTVD